MRKKSSKIKEEELAYFHAAMRDTKPLKQDKIRLRKKSSQKIIRSQPAVKESLLFDHSLTLDPVHGEEFISYKQNGISNKILRNLRKGQYNVEATLDLHGLNVEEAQTAVDDFLQACLQERIRVVLIIHGKGLHSQMPILKNKLNHWLRQLPAVLAFCSASPLHGNRGAIYVLLKRGEQ